MSYWTHIRGVIKVYPFGRTQEEKEYIVKTVLHHLPDVTGSEGGMMVHVVKSGYTDTFCGSDEYGTIFPRGSKRRRELASKYILVVEADLRDRMIEDTHREFVRWLSRLAKRLGVEDMLVKISGFDREIIIDDADAFDQMFEGPSWYNGEINWCEYLMWEEGSTKHPKLLDEKYGRDE